MRHDQRQRLLVPRLDVDEVDVDPVDLGRELRQRVQSRLALAPVVLGRPVAGERLDRRQLHTLGPIWDELSGGPARRLHAAAQLDEILFRNVDREGTDCTVVGHRTPWIDGAALDLHAHELSAFVPVADAATLAGLSAPTPPANQAK